MTTGSCFYFGGDSWSRHARAFFGAWQKQEAIAIESWDAPRDGAVPPGPPATPCATRPNIGLGPIERMATLVGSPRIAYIVWETTIVPAAKVEILQGMDQVWVPSTWGREILIANGIAADRVHVVPEGVDVERFRPLEREARSNRPYRFLFVGKWEARKGVELMIDAYCREFGPDDPVELVMHAWNPYIRDFDLAACIKAAVGRRKTAPIVASLPVGEEEMIRLYNDCDAFVLPTSAEGWGLPITEAMACALPVIVTRYSAPLDYLDDDNAYLIDVRKLVRVYCRHFFPDGRRLGRWARPDIRSLRRIMRHLTLNPEEGRQKGRQARADICAHWTWDDAATTAREILRKTR